RDALRDLQARIGQIEDHARRRLLTREVQQRLGRLRDAHRDADACPGPGDAAGEDQVVAEQECRHISVGAWSASYRISQQSGRSRSRLMLMVQYARAKTTRPAEGLPLTMHLPASFARLNGIQRIVAAVSC